MTTLDACLHLSIGDMSWMHRLALPFVPPVGMQINIDDRGFIVEEVWWNTESATLAIFVKDEDIDDATVQSAEDLACKDNELRAGGWE